MSFRCVLFYLVILFCSSLVHAKPDPEICDIKFEKCEANCDNFYKIAKKDVWGKSRKESEVNKKKKAICKSKCLTLQNNCNKKQKTLIVESELEQNDKIIIEEEKNKETVKITKPSKSRIIKYSDKEGNIHFTNTYSGVPDKYKSNIIR